jgi:tetratricopeptide (TPR) repeat protein
VRKRCLQCSCLYVVLLTLAVSGCAIGNIRSNLSTAILNQDDPGTVRDGAPAYLLLIDSMIAGDPEDPELLSAGARLYSIYSAAFVHDPERAKRLADRAHRYGQRALCSSNENACNMDEKSFDEFKSILKDITAEDLKALYSFTLSWLLWTKANSDDWTAIADLPKIEAALEHIIALDESFELGAPYVYLGILNSLRPPSLGGKPDKARRYFERAIELSDGRNLNAKVEFARSYARLVYDRELHDRLLREVLEADAESPGLTLMNVLAKRDARTLLDSADDYF